MGFLTLKNVDVYSFFCGREGFFRKCMFCMFMKMLTFMVGPFKVYLMDISDGCYYSSILLEDSPLYILSFIYNRRYSAHYIVYIMHCHDYDTRLLTVDEWTDVLQFPPLLNLY